MSNHYERMPASREKGHHHKLFGEIHCCDEVHHIEHSLTQIPQVLLNGISAPKGLATHTRGRCCCRERQHLLKQCDPPAPGENKHKAAFHPGAFLLFGSAVYTENVWLIKDPKVMSHMGWYIDRPGDKGLICGDVFFLHSCQNHKRAASRHRNSSECSFKDGGHVSFQRVSLLLLGQQLWAFESRWKHYIHTQTSTFCTIFFDTGLIIIIKMF